VRLVAWNLLHGLDLTTGRVDLGAVAAALAVLDVDVVAVQEVDRELPRSGRSDQVGELARRLGWHGVFAPALLGDPERRWVPVPADGRDIGGPAYGIGLLSRWPLSRPVRVALPGGGPVERSCGCPPVPRWSDREPRVALRATVPAGHREVVVTTTHLSFVPWRALRQLRRALGLARADTGPAVLLGDLNLPLRTLRLALAGTGWSAARAGPSFPARRPRTQIDHVLVRGVRAAHPRVGPRGPSDHLPVHARLVAVPS
jgi:endonuclease/exonuclease/phosphatase family metal-dependent hydrolase